jgi:hypothetical protein
VLQEILSTDHLLSFDSSRTALKTTSIACIYCSENAFFEISPIADKGNFGLEN